MIKKIYLCVLLLAGYTAGHSQEQFTISNLTSVPQVSYANPALVPSHLRYFIGIPGLSGLQLNGNSRGFVPKDFGVMRLSDLPINYQLAASEASGENIYRFGGHADILYGGIANKSGAFTLNFTERVIGETNFPMDFFRRLASEEFSSFEGNRMYDLEALYARAMHFKELGVSFTTQKRKGVNWGVRLKFLLGQEGIYSDNEGLMLREEEDGSLSTYGNFAFRTAGFQHFSENDKLFRLFSTKNAGVALDAGFHYQYNKRWEFFGSLHDLGGITWRKDLNLREISMYFSDLESEIDETFESLVDEVPETTRTFRTSLPLQLRGGMRYKLKNEHSLSALANARLYETGTDLGLSLAYHMPVASCFEWTASYSVYNQSFANIGAGFAVKVGKVQLYMASDNLISAFAPTSTSNYHLQAGINLLWNKPEKKQRPMANRETIKPEDPTVMTNNKTEEPQAEEETTYFTLSSQFVSGVDGRDVNAIYVDIYRYSADGEKQLIHTSRYPSDQFEVTLYRMHALHELSVRAYGFETLVYQFFPDSDGLERKFTLNADAGSSDK